MTSGAGVRPGTASQPRPATAARGPTAGGETFVEEDDDDGMFAYMPPPPGSVYLASPAMTMPSTPASGGAIVQPRHPSLGAPFHPSGLSPSAAIALAVRNGQRPPPTAVQEVELADGSRRRSVYTYPESPSYTGTADLFPPPPNPHEREDGYHVGSHQTRRRTTIGTPVIDLAGRMSAAGDARSIESGEGKPPSAWPLQHGKTASATGSMLDVYGYGPDGTPYPPVTGMSAGGLSELYQEEEDSPFPEVRASVSNIDDPEMPCVTFRSISIGLLFVAACSMANSFFQLRYPSPYISPILVQIVAYPIGKLLARILPITEWSTPRWMVRLGASETMSLNPGPFNIKEHSVIIIVRAPCQAALTRARWPTPPSRPRTRST